MVEVRFKPSLVGTVADGAITTIKLANEAVTDAKVKSDAAIAKTKLGALAIVDADVSAIGEGKVTNLTTDLGNKSAVGHGHAESDVTNLATDLAAKVSTGPLSGDKKVTAIGWDSATAEVIVDHEA